MGVSTKECDDNDDETKIGLEWKTKRRKPIIPALFFYFLFCKLFMMITLLAEYYGFSLKEIL